jgi:hypothetical protein
MKPAILIACLSPIIFIWIVMKLALWLYVTEEEREYVSKEKFRKRGKFVENPYEDVDEKEEEYGDRTDYR